MRYALLFTLVLSAALAVLSGCNPPPSQSVEMSPPPEPTPMDERPQLTEIRPVDSGTPDDDIEDGDAPRTLSEAAQGRAYVIRKGDTYWKIAAKQLGNGHRWKEIEAMNPKVNRNALKVGQTIQIPAK